MISARFLNIAFRTAHIGAMAVLVGGHAFDVEKSRLIVSLYLTIGTGAALAAVEAGPRLLWFHQLRGLMTLGKLILMGCVPLPLFWDYRLPILLAVVAIASVGSHMPARLRYYSVVTGQIVRDRAGPGGEDPSQ